jgi:hypothetical protein
MRHAEKMELAYQTPMEKMSKEDCIKAISILIEGAEQANSNLQDEITDLPYNWDEEDPERVESTIGEIECHAEEVLSDIRRLEKVNNRYMDILQEEGHFDDH